MELSALNQMDQDTFTLALADIFEHSSWIPESTWQARPFDSLEDLHAKLCDTLDNSSNDQKLALIRAHPDLAGKLAVAGTLTEFSTHEQQSARLDKLTPEQFDRISKLNQRYMETFEFPFIICVKEHNRDEIFELFETRVNHDPETERQAALREIRRIAWHRLNALID